MNTVRLQNISYGHKQSATLRAAIELDLFSWVSEGVATFSKLAGDFTSVPFPRGPDVIIQPSNLPQYNRQALENVMKKGFDALEPGGEYHVVGETVSDQKDGTLGPALWGLHEALFGSRGRAHSEKEVVSYLNNAGFVNVEVNAFIPGSLTRITGSKPA